MAALRRALAAAVLCLAAATGPAVADDPIATPGSGPGRVTCAERFPEAGPAGVDLRLGCIAGEIVGLYTAASGQPPAPISTWVLVTGMVLASGLFATWLVLRALGRRAGRRLAPVLSEAWWVCGRCRSVNGAGTLRCYACGAPPSEGPTMPTTARPETPQSFGGPGSG